jgi:hypothetical protein
MKATWHAQHGQHSYNSAPCNTAHMMQTHLGEDPLRVPGGSWGKARYLVWRSEGRLMGMAQGQACLSTQLKQALGYWQVV